MSQLFKRYSIVVLHTINYAHIYEKCGLNNEIQNLALRGEYIFIDSTKEGKPLEL
jgi:hypothetical protein